MSPLAPLRELSLGSHSREHTEVLVTLSTSDVPVRSDVSTERLVQDRDDASQFHEENPRCWS